MIKGIDKEKILSEWQESINSQNWTALFPFPNCCICFCRLTLQNVTTKDDCLVDVCKTCKAVEDGKCSQLPENMT